MKVLSLTLFILMFCLNIFASFSNISENYGCKYTNKITFKHFWKSTGLSPPDPMTAHEYLLSPDEKFNLILIGSLPHQGIKQVRIHWMLNLITYNVGTKSLNFTNLDILLDLMHGYNLRPGFELMGLPININPVETKHNIYSFWYKLTETIAKRYIGRFGYEEVQKWRFEAMNEPDLKLYNFLNFTLPEYLQYFKACTDALHNVSIIYTDSHLVKLKSKIKSQETEETSSITTVTEPDTVQNQPLIDSLLSKQRRKTKVTISFDVKSRSKRKLELSELRIGGPAGLFKRRDRHPLCWGLLDMCNRTTCHLQFVSFHKKGEGSADQVLSEDLDMLDVLDEYDFTKNIAIANDEADILTNWSLDKEWRADVWYAALMTKVIIEHYKEIVLKRNVSIEVLSNDNGFLNYHPFYFTQRTLLARFQMNNTTPKHVQFIKKPVYVAMGLLSMLGDEFLPTEDSLVSDKLLTLNEDANINVLYTKRTSKYTNVLTVIVVAVNNRTITTNHENQKTVTIKIDIDKFIQKNSKQDNINENTINIDPQSYMITYVLDNERTNPYNVWKEHKNQDFPDKKLRRLIRNNEGPATESEQYIIGNNVGNLLKVSVKIPSIHLINICVDPSLNVVPGEVINLRGYYVTQNEVLLTWNDKKIRSRCIKTYEVEYQSSQNATFQRINDNNLILLTYQHDESNYSPAFRTQLSKEDKVSQDQELFVRYRVRAVDYWDRPGQYSNIINHTNIIIL